MSNVDQKLAADIRRSVGQDKSIALIVGNFNVVHPGHLRLFDFAFDIADAVVVGLFGQDEENVLLSDDLRLSSFERITGIKRTFVVPGSVNDFIAELRPEYIVKGQEHEYQDNPEKLILDSYGGRLLFAPGTFHLSSLDLLRKELEFSTKDDFVFPEDYLKRHNISKKQLSTTFEKFNNLKVIVIGDLIIDEYVSCDALGMSQEDPTLVVSPIKTDRFVGGAAIVAAHAKTLGATVRYFGVSGADDVAEFAEKKLAEYGVDFHLEKDTSRPTSLKQRFRAGNKTLLRVSHLRSHDIEQKLVETFCYEIKKMASTTDLLIFSDFNYGALPDSLVKELTNICKMHNIVTVADSQSSSQIGDITRFHGMKLLTPTERESRIASKNSKSSLTILAEELRQHTNSGNVIITLGGEGVLIQTEANSTNPITTDKLPAFNPSPKDVAGGGDSLLTGAALALACGSSIWESAFIGSMIAGIQVSSVGNRPIKKEEATRKLEK